jgi:hypothetical protein
VLLMLVVAVVTNTILIRAVLAVLAVAVLLV